MLSRAPINASGLLPSAGWEECQKGGVAYLWIATVRRLQQNASEVLTSSLGDYGIDLFARKQIQSDVGGSAESLSPLRSQQCHLITILG